MDITTLSLHTWRYRHHFIFKEQHNPKNIYVQCVLCMPKVNLLSSSRNSTSNLKKHLVRRHRGTYEASRAGEPSQPETDGAPNSKKQRLEKIVHETLQPKVDALVFNFLVQDVQPFSAVEQPAFRKLIEGLSGGKMTMNRKTLTAKVEKAFSNMKEELVSKLGNVKSLCTTADVWTVHHRSFFGMTCHWIDENDLERKSVALACARIRGGHTCDAIAAKIHEIHVAYNIESKIQATVTGNGSHFVKAFKEFDDQADEEDRGRVEDVCSILERETDAGMHLFLLPLRRCASHTLNSIASEDLAAAVSQGASHELYCSAMAKCAAVGNKANRPPLAASALEGLETMMMTVPGVARWNTEYCVVQKMMSLTEAQLGKVCDSLEVARLQCYEIEFLKDYVEVWKPLAVAIDLLQGEQKCFLGLVIPTLLTLKKKLWEKKSITCYFSDHISVVLEAIDSRFQRLFASVDAKMATATMPQFRLWWVREEAEREEMRLVLVAEASQVELSSEEKPGSWAEPLQSDQEEDFFSYGPGNAVLTQGGAAEEVRTYLEGTNKHLDSLKDFPRLRKLFLKFNSPLPSSAPVERLYSHEGNLFTPQRNGLTDEHFEQVLLLRYNSKMCPLTLE